MTEELLLTGLMDMHPGVRRAAVRLAESRLAKSAALVEAVGGLTADTDPAVRYQVGLSAWHMPEPKAGLVLQQLVGEAIGDAWMRAAVINSSARAPLAVLRRVVSDGGAGGGRDEMIRELAALVVKLGTDAAAADALAEIAPLPEAPFIEPWRLEAAAAVLEVMHSRKLSIDALSHSEKASAAIRQMIQTARKLVAAEGMPLNRRSVATELLLHEPQNEQGDIKLLAGLLRADVPPALQTSAAIALARSDKAEAIEALLAGWRRVSPGVRVNLFDLLAGGVTKTEAALRAMREGRIGTGELSAEQ